MCGRSSSATSLSCITVTGGTRTPTATRSRDARPTGAFPLRTRLREDRARAPAGPARRPLDRIARWLAQLGGSPPHNAPGARRHHSPLPAGAVRPSVKAPSIADLLAPEASSGGSRRHRPGRPRRAPERRLDPRRRAEHRLLRRRPRREQRVRIGVVDRRHALCDGAGGRRRREHPHLQRGDLRAVYVQHVRRVWRAYVRPEYYGMLLFARAVPPRRAPAPRRRRERFGACVGDAWTRPAHAGRADKRRPAAPPRDGRAGAGRARRTARSSDCSPPSLRATAGVTLAGRASAPSPPPDGSAARRASRRSSHAAAPTRCRSRRERGAPDPPLRAARQRLDRRPRPRRSASSAATGRSGSRPGAGSRGSRRARSRRTHRRFASGCASATWAPRRAGSRGEATGTPRAARRASASAIANSVSAMPLARMRVDPGLGDERDALVDGAQREHRRRARQQRARCRRRARSPGSISNGSRRPSQPQIGWRSSPCSSART